MNTALIKKLMAVAAVGIGGLSVLGVAAQLRSTAILYKERSFTLRSVPVPYPRDGLTGAALEAVAIESGEQAMRALVGCMDCHGEDLAGGGEVEMWPMMHLRAPNITPGGVTADYTVEDWDRIVRHGVRKDGRAAMMPVMESHFISDQELSDVIAYARSVPAVHTQQPPSQLYLPGKALLSIGLVHLSADEIDQHLDQPARPPDSKDTAAYGAHLATACKGCHGATLQGGPIPAAPPNWPDAADLTASGLGTWSEADFVGLMRTGRRPDGTEVDPIMPWRISKNMTDEDLHALWTHLTSLPAKAAQ